MNDTISNNTNTIDKLLKDELSAVETYQCLLEAFKLPGGHFVSDSLMPMYKDHQDAVSSLKTQVQQESGNNRIVRGRKKYRDGLYASLAEF